MCQFFSQKLSSKYRLSLCATGEGTVARQACAGIIISWEKICPFRHRWRDAPLHLGTARIARSRNKSAPQFISEYRTLSPIYLHNLSRGTGRSAVCFGVDEQIGRAHV